MPPSPFSDRPSSPSSRVRPLDSARRDPPRKPTACVACHNRKLRCDASERGVPCSRCRSSDRPGGCFLPPSQPRRRRRKTPAPSQYAAPTVAAGPQPAIPAPLPATTFSAEICSVPSSESVDEEDVPARICQEMAFGYPHALSRPRPGVAREYLEYQNGMNATAILGEVLGRKDPKRLVKVTLVSSNSASNPSPGRLLDTRELELSGLEPLDRDYLHAKAVFDLPQRDVCDDFLRLYFQRVYPYAPIVDRREFLQQYENGQQSSFVMQSLLANVVPYAPAELINRAGYPDHVSASRTYYKNAVLLYDFNCEKNQLGQLQGSLFLGTQWTSHFGDKDFRFWLLNAVRIATRMGIHKQHIEHELEPKFHKLLRRIWWAIYVRDVLCTISGLENVRRIVAADCDTAMLTEDDWVEDPAPLSQRLENLINPVSRVEKLFLIQTSKLSIIGDKFHQTMRKSASDPRAGDSELLKLLQDIKEWRIALPEDLRVDMVREWNDDCTWIMTLMAWCYRMECLIYRFLRKCYEGVDHDREKRSSHQLANVLFDLDSCIRKVVVHEIERYLPLSFSTSVATAVALHIEALLNPSTTKSHRFMSEESVKIGIAYLKASQLTWPLSRPLLRLFEWVFTRTNLPFDTGVDRTQDQEQVALSLGVPLFGQNGPNGTHPEPLGAPLPTVEAINFDDGLFGIDLDRWFEWE